MVSNESHNHNPPRRRTGWLMTGLGYLMAVTLMAGAYSLWVHGNIPVYVQTSLLTVAGGLFAFVGGQIVQKSCIEPLQDLQKTIGEISSAILFYANSMYETTKEEWGKEAATSLRKLSGEIQGRKRVIPHYDLFARLGVVPTYDDIKKASAALIRLSNAVGTGRIDSFTRSVDEIKEALWL